MEQSSGETPGFLPGHCWTELVHHVCRHALGKYLVTMWRTPLKSPLKSPKKMVTFQSVSLLKPPSCGLLPKPIAGYSLLDNPLVDQLLVDDPQSTMTRDSAITKPLESAHVDRWVFNGLPKALVSTVTLPKLPPAGRRPVMRRGHAMLHGASQLSVFALWQPDSDSCNRKLI